MHIYRQMPLREGHEPMHYRYLVASAEELIPYQKFVDISKPRMDAFLDYLKDQYSVNNLPNAVILTDMETATTKISSIPLPGFTNEFRTVFCPGLEVWRSLYLQQLRGTDDPAIRIYYEMGLTENHVLSILGHEFVHHSDLFIDEAYENARWFEEGMCEYISRSWFLTDAEFEAASGINGLLVERYEKKHGIQSLEEFTRDTYVGTLEDIFYFYWKSFLAVRAAVQRFGNTKAVFREYDRWFVDFSATPLSVWLAE